MITIAKECFVGPIIHEKIKKMPSGRKRLVVKQIPRDVNISEKIRDGRITIENCIPCWRKSADEWKIDMMAVSLLWKMLREYQEDEIIPENVGIYK